MLYRVTKSADEKKIAIEGLKLVKSIPQELYQKMAKEYLGELTTLSQSIVLSVELVGELSYITTLPEIVVYAMCIGYMARDEELRAEKVLEGVEVSDGNRDSSV